MSIYDYDVAAATEELLPVAKRQPNWLATLGVQGNKLQYLHDLFFGDYADGATMANVWVTASAYSFGDKAIDKDNAVYQVVNPAGVSGSAIQPGHDLYSAANLSGNWIKVLNDWIGVRERTRYTGQKLMLEYILNKRFMIGSVALPFAGPSHTTQIYITNTYATQSNFWLSNGGPQSLTSYMANRGQNSKMFMGNSYTYNPNSFTIHVPTTAAAKINTLSPKPLVLTYYIAVITQLVNKYCTAGLKFNIITY